MTRILLADVLPQQSNGWTLYPAYLDVTLVNGNGTPETRRYEIPEDTIRPAVELTPPAINTALRLVLHSVDDVWNRTVTFSGESVNWLDLTDVDPSTLQPVPVNEALAAWIAVRDQLLEAVAHIAAPDLSPYAKLSDIPHLPNLEPYALKSELPVLPDLTPYAKLTDLPVIPPAPDLSPYALLSEIPVVPPPPDLTPYALKSELPAGTDLSQYAKLTDIPTVPAPPDLTPYALKTDIPAAPDLTPYALKTSLPDLTPYALKTQVPAAPDLTPYALKTSLPDLTPYAKKTDIPAAPDLSPYALKTQLPTGVAGGWSNGGSSSSLGAGDITAFGKLVTMWLSMTLGAAIAPGGVICAVAPAPATYNSGLMTGPNGSAVQYYIAPAGGTNAGVMYLGGNTGYPSGTKFEFNTSYRTP